MEEIMNKRKICHKLALTRDKGIPLLTPFIDWIRYEILECYND